MATVSVKRSIVVPEIFTPHSMYMYIKTALTFRHTTFHRAYLVALPHMNLTCRQWPLHTLRYPGLLQGAIERCHVTLPWQQNFWITTIGSLSNDNDDNNENGKKALGLYQPDNNFARASQFFFVHFLAVVERLPHERS